MAQRDHDDAGVLEEGLRSDTSLSQPKAISQLPQRSAGAIHQEETISAKCHLPGKTNSDFQALLEDLDLWRFYPHKLPLKDNLQLFKSNINKKPPESLRKIAMCFINEILRENSKSRTINYCSEKILGEEKVSVTEDYSFLKRKPKKKTHSESILDLIVGVFLCSDNFLQQTLMAKMSLCQFSLPLLLPDLSTGSLTFLLWAMRSVTHIWRPHSMGSKGYVEDSMATTRMPMISFMRIGDWQISKSEEINSFLSRNKYDSFVHRNMKCGDVPRKIANGLVEIFFSLPRGNENSDIFSDIVAVLNLRGDVRDNPTQFQFLKEISASMFIFLEKVGEKEYDFLISNFKSNDKPYLILDAEGAEETNDNLVNICKSLELQQKNVFLFETSQKMAFNENLKQFIVNAVDTSNSAKTSLQEMTKTAVKLKIDIDETAFQDSTNATQIIMNDILKRGIQSFKQTMLPCQGNMWQEWAGLDKEQCRLKNIDGKNPCEYRDEIKMKKHKLREKQSKQDLSLSMETFMQEFLKLHKHRNVNFLQCMKIELESLSKQEAQKKHQNEQANRQEEVTHSTTRPSSSLGIEHFMREVAQIYEASKACNTNHDKYKVLPSIMAKLLLDGFPMELMDGDAGCIPKEWVTDVLGEVRHELGSDVRVLVLSVVGVQSSGKSTLLNIMFGLQFSVSSGRCTRGVFMHLISIDDELKKQLKFDFVLVIDSEGLKSSEFLQIDARDQCDSELATFVIGLSDAVLFNLRMENAEELKDILHIVVNAFIRMTETGKKPCCLFVHQGSEDLSAHHKNAEARANILKLLDHSTAEAAKMENKDAYYTRFTDVIEYDVLNDNWYLPALWTGGSTVKLVSSEYSEKAFDLKINLLEKFTNGKTIYSLSHFSEWIDKIWTAMKKENFDFSFKNFLVIDAYDNLYRQYSDLEKEFRDNINSWIENVDDKFCKSPSCEFDQLCTKLETELKCKVSVKKDNISDKLNRVFAKHSEDYHLIRKYKRDLETSFEKLSDKILHEAHVKFEKLKSVHIPHAVAFSLFKQQMAKDVEHLLEKHKTNSTQYDANIIISEVNEMCSKFIYPENNKIQGDLKVKLSSVIVKYEAIVKGRLCCQTLRDFVVKMEANHVLQSDTHVSQASISAVVTNIIKNCIDFIENKAKTSTNYSCVHWDELLSHLDSLLNTTNEGLCNDDLKEDIKLYVCALAIEAFVKQDKQCFEQKLSDLKRVIIDIVKQMVQDGDEKRNVAATFCNYFIKPAIDRRIHQQLGAKVATMLREKCDFFSSQKNLQISILFYLIKIKHFYFLDDFLCSNEEFTRTYVKDYIVNFCNNLEHGGSHDICTMKNLISSEVQEQLKKSLSIAAAQCPPKTVSDLLRSLTYPPEENCTLQHTELLDIFSSYCLDAKSLKEFTAAVITELDRIIKEMQPQCSYLCDVAKLLDDLHVQPHEELLKPLRGCGQHCPLCRAPCDRGGSDHSEHAATIHYPQRLLGRGIHDNTFTTDVCTTSLAKSKYQMTHTFSNEDTQWNPVMYSQYRTVNAYYKSWNIPPDPNMENPEVWKYIVQKFKEELTRNYEAKEKDIPLAWADVTVESLTEDLMDRGFGKPSVSHSMFKWILKKISNFKSAVYIVYNHPSIFNPFTWKNTRTAPS